MRMFAAFFSLVLVLFLSACAGGPMSKLSVVDMPAFQVGEEDLSSEEALSSTNVAELLAVTPAMTQYFDRYITKEMTQQQRARMLHRTLLSPAFLNIEYMRRQTLTAEQVFDRQTANCIGFANVFVAMARHYGLDAHFQLIKKYPQWVRKGELVSMDVHVNSVVELNFGATLTVDINRDGFRPSEDPQVMNDKQAVALFYNNLAVEALQNEDSELAYRYLVVAVDRAPGLSLLWSNLGALYRSNDQHLAAEKMYLQALQLDSSSFTAMNNLALLYQIQGRSAEQLYYENKTERLRLRNPYYHYFLARRARDQHEYRQAIKHLQRAIAIKKDDDAFYQLMTDLQRQLEPVAINVVNADHTL